MPLGDLIAPMTRGESCTNWREYRRRRPVELERLDRIGMHRRRQHRESSQKRSTPRPASRLMATCELRDPTALKPRAAATSSKATAGIQARWPAKRSLESVAAILPLFWHDAWRCIVSASPVRQKLAKLSDIGIKRDGRLHAQRPDRHPLALLCFRQAMACLRRGMPSAATRNNLDKLLQYCASRIFAGSISGIRLRRERSARQTQSRRPTVWRNRRRRHGKRLGPTA